MKRTILVIILILSMFAVVFSQQQEKTYSVPESQLTAEQKAKIQISQVSGYAGLGKEIGDAIGGGLHSLNTEVNSFSESPAGKFTMFIIAYKVIGNDFVQFLIGIPLWLIGSMVWAILFYRNVTIRKVVTKKEGFFLWPKKEYKVIQLEGDDLQVGYVGYGVFYVVFSIIAGFVTFG
jgi:hypothetical protein